jgi:transcriptional regulator
MAKTELLSGTLDLLVLRVLHGGPLHGFAIAERIHLLSKEVLSVEEGSLYPALYRMERDGWVEADWGKTESGRKAKFYRITDQGRRQLRAETREFAGFVKAVSPLLLQS